MKVFLFAVVGMLVVDVANANLQVNQYSALGTNCYSEDEYGWRLVECRFNVAVDRNPDLQECSDTIDGVAGNLYCYVSGGDKSWRICVEQVEEEYSEFMSEACEELAYIDDSKKSAGGNKVSYEYVASWNHDNVGNWFDSMNVVKETVYGCAANYYTNATSPSASMTCLPCPSSGKSAIGNTAITGCYIPANTILTDVSGSYEFISDCYYSK